MGVEGRLVVPDFSPSRRPEDGELVKKDGDVMVGVRGQYVSVHELRSQVRAMSEVVFDPVFQEMLEGYRAARRELLAAGETQLSLRLF